MADNQRQIKFRAFNKHTGEMVDLYKVTPLILNTTEQDGLFLPFDNGYVLMQFTGLHDSAGVEIFEGDILRLAFSKGEIAVNPAQALTHLISYENGAFGFIPTHPHLKAEEDRDWRPFWDHEEQDTWLEYMTVIGNIHQHPHLLTEAK